MTTDRKEKSGSGLPAWLVVLVALADDLAVLVIVLLALWFFRVRISLPVVILLAVVLGTFVFIVHRAIIPSLRRRKVTGSEGMLGARGKAATDLAPEGMVLIEGEYWRAKAAAGAITAGREIEVVAIDRLFLTVKAAED